MNKRINNQSNIKKMNGWVSETIRKHNGPLHLFFPNPNCIEIWNYNIFLNFFKIIMSTWIFKAVLKLKKTLNKIVFGIYSQGLKHGNVIFFFFFFYLWFLFHFFYCRNKISKFRTRKITIKLFIFLKYNFKSLYLRGSASSNEKSRASD